MAKVFLKSAGSWASTCSGQSIASRPQIHFTEQLFACKSNRSNKVSNKNVLSHQAPIVIGLFLNCRAMLTIGVK